MTIAIVLQAVLAALIGYLIGSIPTGYLIVKWFKGEDIRKIGSGSTGATNVKRVMGRKWFYITLFLDLVKGMIPVLLALPYRGALWGIIPVIAAVFVLLGHSKSIFLKFSGGKCVASGFGTILALDWMSAIVFAIAWVLIVKFSKFVSLGSIIAIWLTPIAMFIFNRPLAYIAYSLAGAIYITYLHRENIQRLIKGQESETEL